MLFDDVVIMKRALLETKRVEISQG